MKRIHYQIIFLLIVCFTVFVAYSQFKSNGLELNIVGIMDYCESHNCINNYIQIVEVYDNSNSVSVISKGDSAEAIYGGNYLAQVCTAQEGNMKGDNSPKVEPCKNLDISKLPDYKIVSFI